ncbi:MAG: HD domain-containing protein [Deltaproteobacteria bacterium]|nr:HD domain-containing protein [Deltaproteobacteria bacterium]
MSTRPTIDSLEPGSQVELPALVQDLALRATRSGKPYLALTLVDRTGQLQARAWEEGARLHALVKNGDAVLARGQVETFGAQLQLNLRGLEMLPWDEETRRRLLPASRRDPDVMWGELLAAVEALEDPELRGFLRSFVESPQVREGLRTAPAARTVHHAWVGGLLEHTVSMLAVAAVLVEHYRALVPSLRRDLVLAGVIVHDAGKVLELGGEGSGLGYTTRGKLLGHMALAVQLLERHRAAGHPLAEATMDALIHLILAHHGDREKGSPVNPATAEALLLHHVDLLDSRMAMAGRLLEDAGPDGWTSLDRFLGSSLYRPVSDPGDRAAPPVPAAEEEPGVGGEPAPEPRRRNPTLL